MTEQVSFDNSHIFMALDPFYTVVSNNAFLQSQWMEDIKSQMPAPLETLRVDTKSKKPAQVLDLLYTYPMMGSSKLVIVDQAKELDEKSRNGLLSYIASPTMQTFVIWNIPKIDKRKKFYKTLIEQTNFVQLDTPKLGEMSSWVDKLAKKRKLTIDRAAKMMLIDFVGTDVGRLDAELNKLSLFIHPKTKIEKDDVVTMVLKLSGDDIFTCTDAVIDGNAKKALQSLHFLFESGVSPFAITSMFTRHLRILLKLKSAQVKRVGRGQLASYVGVPPFTLGKYQQQAKKYAGPKSLTALKKLQQLDIDMKSTGIGQNRLLEKTVISILRS